MDEAPHFSNQKSPAPTTPPPTNKPAKKAAITISFLLAGSTPGSKARAQKYGFGPEEVAAAGDWVFWIRIIEGGHRANFAHCRQPTCLHFVADWRKAQESTYYAARDQLHVKGWAPILMQVDFGLFTQS